MVSSRMRKIAFALVAAGAAAMFMPGTTMTLGWVDEGQIVYPAWRVARGELPYRDVHHVYGPSLFFLNGALLHWFGEDLFVIRLGLLGIKSLLAALVFSLTLRVSRPWIALLVTSWFVALWWTPLWVFSTPYASHYALAFGLSGLTILVTGPLGTWRRAIVAGLCFGLAATFKQTTGLFVAAGMLVVLASMPAPGDVRDRLAWTGRHLRVAVSVGAVSIMVAYLGRGFGTWTVVLVAAAPLLALVAERLRDQSIEGSLAAGRPRLTGTLAFALGCGLPVAGWAAVYARWGALRELVHDTALGLPQRIDWFVPLAPPDVHTAVFGTALAVGAAALAGGFGPRRVCGLGLAAIAAVAAVAPPYGGVSIRALSYLPIALVWASAPLALRTADAATPRLLWWFGAFGCLALYPASDVLHALMILPAVLPLLALLLEGAWAAAGSALLPRVFVAVLTLAPMARVTSQALSWFPAWEGVRLDGSVGFPRASHLRDEGPSSREMRDVLAALDRIAPRGAPLLVLPSAQLLYVLADRPSAVPRAEMVVYLLTIDGIRREDARALVSEEGFQTALRETVPVIVRSTDVGWQRIAESYPAVARWIEARYEVAATIGTRQILTPRRTVDPGR